MSKRKSKSADYIQAEHDRIAAEAKARVDATRSYADYRRRLVAEGRVDPPKNYDTPLDFSMRSPVVRAWVDDEIIVDNFAGGGGASSGIYDALGVDPFVAVNHDAEAIAMHRANHPSTNHYVEDVFDVDPREATNGRTVGLAWFSPDCTHFSKAVGGKPRDQKIRGLAWVATKWAEQVAPRVICLENVEEFRDWGPLHERHHGTCTKAWRKSARKCKKTCRWSRPVVARKGETFREFVASLEALGYVVEHRLLRACDYGAPTTRRRLFLVARRDGRAIRWPSPTHGPGLIPYRTAAECIDWSVPVPSIFDRDRPLADKTLARIARGVRKYVLEAARPFVVPQTHGDKDGKPDTRSHSIDEPLRTITSLGAQFHLVAPTLVPVTHAGYRDDGTPRDDRRGYDIAAPAPTITGANRGEIALVVPSLVAYHSATSENGHRVADVDAPLATIDTSNRFALVAPTLLKAKTYGGGGNDATDPRAPLGAITASKRGEHAVAAAYLVHRSNGERPGQAPRTYDVEKPLGTIVGQGEKHALCLAFLNKHHGGHESSTGGQSVERPIDTVTAQRNKSVTVAHLSKYYGTSTGCAVDEPAPTITAGGDRAGIKLALVHAFLTRYNGQSVGQAAEAPIGTLDTTDRYAVVTVKIDGEDYIIADIGMRMLTPRELYRCQGFRPTYKIDVLRDDGEPLTKTAQVRMVGNSVSPHPARAVVAAQFEEAA